MAQPTLADLQGMYGLGSASAYTKARENADLERQFRESEYGRQQELTKKATLDNMYQQQADPLRIQGLGLENEGKSLGNLGQVQTNRKSTVEANLAESTQQFKFNEAQRKELLQASDQDINMFKSKAQRMRQSNDPAERKMGEQLYGFTEAALAEKAKYAHELEKLNIQEAGDTKRTGMSNATQIKTTQMGIDAGKYTRVGTAKTVEARLAGAKNPTEKAEILESAYYEAKTAGDTAAAQVYQDRAIAARQRAAEGAANAGLAKPGTTIEGGKIVGTPRPSADAPIAGSTSGGNKPAQRKPLSQY